MCTTALAEARWELYVVGLSMSPVAQVTDLDHGGGSGEEETEDQLGSPERLIEVTSHPRATADLQIREPKKPLPPATTIFFFAAVDMV